MKVLAGTETEPSGKWGVQETSVMWPEAKGSPPRETRHRPATGQLAVPGMRNQSFR